MSRRPSRCFISSSESHSIPSLLLRARPDASSAKSRSFAALPRSGSITQIRAVVSRLAVTTRVPSGLKAACETLASCRSGLPIGSPVRCLLLTRHHPRPVPAEGGARDLGLIPQWRAEGSPVRASQIRAFSCTLAVSTRVPSGLKAACKTESACCSGLPIGSPVRASQIRAVASSLAVSTLVPSGLKTASLTSSSIVKIW
jgi:hypothetical protein